MLERFRAEISPGGEEGTFRAVASAADSIANGERGPTRFLRGAFRDSIETSGGKLPLLWQHREDQPIGVARLSEGDEGLLVDGRLAMDVQQAREAHSLMKLGSIDGISIGFNAKKAKHVTREGETVREVERAELAEISLVTFPADKKARVYQVHSGAAMVEDEIGELSSLVESLENAAGHEGHTGRVFSEANLGKLRAALGALVELVEKVDPGHIASLGRKAARILKRSFLHTTGAKARAARHRDSARMDELRRWQMHFAYPGAPVEDEGPRARLFDDINDEEEEREEQWRLQRVLMQSIGSILGDPRVSNKPDMIRDSVSQYLIAMGDAEGDEEEDEESDGAGPEEEHAVWTAAYINRLPDSSFAVIEPGGKKDDEGRTVPRSLRHLPFKDAGGKVDLPHLRNALSRLPQTDISADLKTKARKKLLAAASSAGVGEAGEGDAAGPPDETHIHDPRVEKRGDRWAVVDSDGKVYGLHDSREKAEAQRRALRAASGN